MTPEPPRLVPVHTRFGGAEPARAPRAHRAVGALILREMATTYGRSPGGWLWAVIEPAAAIALLSFAFSLAFRAPPLGTSFALFYASGYLFYMVFHDLSQKVATAIRISKPLFSFGAVTCLDALIARMVLNAITHTIVMTLVLGTILAIAAPGQSPDMPRLGLALVMAVALAFGVGLVNAFLFTAFPAWERLWAIALRPLFIVSGVVFLFEDVPAPFQDWLWWNPLFHVTALARQAIYPGYDPAYLGLSYVLALALGLTTLGLLLLDRFADDLIQK